MIKSLIPYRWADTDPERIALVWEKDEPGDTERISYAELKSMVSKMANLLKQVRKKKENV